MAFESIVVTVDRDIADLVPLFLEQRKTDLEAMAAAIPEGDFAALRRIGHGMAGSGSSFGFDTISALGERLMLAARAGDTQTLRVLQAELADYLERVVVNVL